MIRPVLLDLYCGAGGIARGYELAGFEVVGVDHRPQPHYPYRFYQADALEFLRRLIGWPHVYAAVHASPPCQVHTMLKAGPGHEDLIPATRELLEQLEVPYVIENVQPQPLRDPVKVCGGGWLPVVTCRDGIERRVRRHRYFETNWPCLGHACSHPYPSLGVYGHGHRPAHGRTGAYSGTAAEARAGMAIEWMNRDELAQAIPPGYGEHIGLQLAAWIERTGQPPVASSVP